MSSKPLHVLRDAKCSTHEKILLYLILSHSNQADGNGGFPSVRLLAEEAGISTSTTWIVLGSMRDRGWLSRSTGQGRKSNTYTIHFDRIPSRRSVAPSDTQADCQENRSVSISDPLCIDSDPVVYRSEVRSVSPSDTEVSTRRKTEDDDDEAPSSSSSSSSFSLLKAQKLWNQHRGSMRESKPDQLFPHDLKLFAARVKDGFTEELCQQTILKMAALPYFRGEVNGTIGSLRWLLDVHKETGEPNFQRVLREEYDPHPVKKPKPVTTIGLNFRSDRPMTYKDLLNEGKAASKAAPIKTMRPMREL
jgi:hypothetical protein